MVALHVAFLIVCCLCTLLIGYILGHKLGKLEFQKENPIAKETIIKNEMPVVVEIVNKIYPEENFTEDKTPVASCSEAHRPNHLHKITNIIGSKSKEKLKS